MHDEIAQYSIQSLLGSGVNYLIPMYQRNYAWEEGEITQLIQDVMDYLPLGQNYYIGTLVVFERRDGSRTVYETIDGQQRLTTLTLLVSYLKHTKLCDVSWFRELTIDFDSREHSRQTLRAIYHGDFEDDSSKVLGRDQINAAILNGYRLIKKILPQKIKENNGAKDDNEYKDAIKKFAHYLCSCVQIMRVKVPSDTDLNHYFEIMNSRGEQLEKHEVLKARLLEILKDDEDSKNCLHLVWEACANMEKYVQMGFSTSQRDALFGGGDWGQLKVDNFEQLKEALKDRENSRLDQASNLDLSGEQKLSTIIDAPNPNAKSRVSKEDAPERFNSVINFQNFLLHVLLIHSKQKEIPLDDKRLIESFEKHLIKVAEPDKCVKAFTFDLIRCKSLYDRYIIKREYLQDKDGWSLKRLKRNDGGKVSYVESFGEEESNSGDNRRVLMLLSAFHVSAPTQVYKYWLNAALNYLFHAPEIQTDKYISYLESVAKAFVFDRFICSSKRQEYVNIIHVNNGNCQTTRSDVTEEEMKKKLSYGCIENNLVFNFLDYLLWLKYQSTGKIVNDFDFSFRSSVEHYYPQHPLPGHDPLPNDALNSFGNLCLISHSKNSRLSNFMPEAKKEYYRNNTIDSVKQYLMMKDQTWDASTIARHEEEMFEVLLTSLEDKSDVIGLNKVAPHA